MTTKTTALWILTLACAGAAGWFAAMEIQQGPAFANEEDAYERFLYAFSVTDTLDRTETVARLIRRLTPETLPGAIRAFYDDPKDIFNHDFRMLMWYWGQQDPRGMLKEVSSWPEMRAQRMAAGEAIYWIVKQEGLAPAKFIFDGLPNHQRDPALAHLVLGAIESGEESNLLDVIDAYDWRDERDFAAGIVVGRILLSAGPEKLIEWVEGIPEGPGSTNDLKAVAFRAAQDELMRHDEFETLENWLERVEGEKWTRGGGWRTIGVHLARRDPIRAIEWARALSEERGRDEVLSETVRAFASADRMGALNWMRTQTPSYDLDKGTARLVYEFKDRHPSIAIEMLDRVQDPEIFENARKLIEVAARDDPEDVQAIILEELSRLAPRGYREPSAAESDAPSS
jgi:hypothetical protein